MGVLKEGGRKESTEEVTVELSLRKEMNGMSDGFVEGKKVKIDLGPKGYSYGIGED